MKWRKMKKLPKAPRERDALLAYWNGQMWVYEVLYSYLHEPPYKDLATHWAWVDGPDD